jgi:cyclic beta-1,2-glucan synthetase
VRLEVDRLRIEPLMPEAWDTFEVHYRHRDAVHHIHVRRVGAGRQVTRVVFDGAEQAELTIPLRVGAGEHEVEVEVGGG